MVAFESSLSGCAVADERIGAATPRDVMRDCIFQVWHSSETLGLFEYLDTVRKAKGSIKDAGPAEEAKGAKLSIEAGVLFGLTEGTQDTAYKVKASIAW